MGIFKGNYYSCDPREEDDKDKGHLWPGLTKDDDGNLLPCCFKMNQYNKTSSLLYKYINSKEEQIEPKKITSGVGYIKASNKALEPGRYGDLPYNWIKLLTFLGEEKIEKGKQKTFPILLYSPIHSPDSFIHCMETATNDEYIYLSDQEKNDALLKLKDSAIHIIVNGKDTEIHYMFCLRNQKNVQ